MPDRIFTYEIEEHFGTISERDDGWRKELNLIRWNGGPAKYDIREWDEHHDRMKKGVTLSLWEMRKLIELFVSRNNDAAVARGRAIEAERNARRIAARQKQESVRAETERAAELTPPEPVDQVDQMDQMDQVEQEALEGAIPPDEPEMEAAAVETPDDAGAEEMQEGDF